MEGLQVVVALGAAILVMSIIANRTPIPLPLLLLAGGVALGSIPALRETPLPPQVVLVLFLPALLYWESLSMSLREIRRNIRVITINSTVLVMVTAVAVAATAHALGMPWAPAFVLGAAVAPTDATAMAAVARTLPRRTQTILRAESLINDGTALVLYAVAVEVSVGSSTPADWQIAGRLLLAYAAGAAVGLAVAWSAGVARRVANKPIIENVVSITTPFVAYLVAEQLDGSGVVAVVICGLALTQVGPREVSARTRLQARAFWQLSTYVLNSALFLLVGLQVYSIVKGLGSRDLLSALRDAGFVLGVVIGVRLALAYTLVYVIRAVDRRAVQRAMRVGARQRFATAWAGPRGAISLAAALAIPTTTHSGAPFPDRGVIIFTTFVVIVGTLVIQGATLGPVVRWSRLPEDRSVDHEIELAEQRMGEASHAALSDTAKRLGSSPEVVARLQHLYEDSHRDDADEFSALRWALLEVKRAEVVRLRDAQEIDDIVLRRVQTRLDREETALGIDPDED